LVVQPQKNRRRLVVRAAETFTSVGIDLFGIVINRVGNDAKGAAYGYGTEYGYGYGYGYGAGYGDDANDEKASIPIRVA
jgi:polysaccharide biosynthesis transport protein